MSVVVIGRKEKSGEGRRRMTRFCDLPDEVVVEIMSYVPPKFLLQLKCVQKSWYALISILVKSEWFVAKHLKNSERYSSIFQKGVPPYPAPYHILTSFMAFNEGDSDNELICFDIKELGMPLLPKKKELGMPLSITGERASHCNGILFLLDQDTNEVLLWNPAIREFKILQSSCFGSNFKNLIMVGFGCDMIANVYKVVRVVRLHSSNVGPPVRVEVCTLGGNNSESWKEIEMNLEIDHDTCATFDEVYHKGVYYWLVAENDQSGSFDLGLRIMLVSFDFHKEEFLIIPLPEDHDHDRKEDIRTVSLSLCLWGECLTLFRFGGSVFSIMQNSIPKVKMWTLDEFSSSCPEQRFVWTRYDLGLGNERQYWPVVFWKSDELLLFAPQEAGIGLLAPQVVDPYFSYNLRTQKLRRVKLNFRIKLRYFRAVVYVESLVSAAF